MNTKNTVETYAVDFETFYSKEVSIKTLGPIGYFSHPEFDAYMVSVVGTDGTSWAGHPKDFDWSLLEGQICLSHNASFDETLYLFGIGKGWWPKVQPLEWHCTADMAAYLGYLRSLKGASEEILDIVIEKTTRDNMRGRRWEDMGEDFQKEVLDYATKDSELCLDIWLKVGDQWPEHERVISLLNRKGLQQGIPVNSDKIRKAHEKLTTYKFELEQSVPWAGEKPLLSRPAFNEACVAVGIDPPVSLAQTDPAASSFFEKYEEEYPWVVAIRDWRRVNTLEKKVKAFQNGSAVDGRFYGNIMYAGAHTLRFSGGGGNLNLQNLPRGDMFGINMRNFFEAPKGKKFLVVDLSQIEVRTVCYLAKWGEMLKRIAGSEDIYQVFAVAFGLWDDSKGALRSDGDLRSAVKEMVLSCQYQVGKERFSSASGLSLAESDRLVKLYRKTMKPIVDLWDSYQEDIRGAQQSGQDFTVALPTRNLNYGRVRKAVQHGKSQFVVLMPKQHRRVPTKIYGGKVTENAAQAFARDVFGDMLIRIDEQMGMRPLFHVHDEFIYEVDEDSGEEDLAKVLDIMGTPPDWAPELPVAAEGGLFDHYTK